MLLSINPILSSAQCVSDCQVQCQSQINISLDQSCEAEITPATGGVGITPICNEYYSIVLYDQYGNQLPSNIVDISYLDENLKYEITEPECGNRCWGYIHIEYKLPPQIECPDFDTLTCGAYALLDFPNATSICSAFDIFLSNEEFIPISCDPLATQKVVRTYTAVDIFGNYNSCTDTIIIRRVNLDDVIFPPFLTVGNNNPILCNEGKYEFDEYGHPVPWPTGPDTGSGSGVPIICDPNIVDGIFCPTENDYTGSPLLPGINHLICNALVTYTDIELPKINCVKKIMRTWEIREWWCNLEFTVGDIQLIEIIDNEAPDFICPYDFTVSTDYDCGAQAVLPPVYAHDYCAHGVIVKIDYGKGYVDGNGGIADLDYGLNLVHYIVSDECNNSSSCSVNVTVEDHTEPVAICEQHKVVSLSLSGNTIVFAEPFDNGSWDECHLDRFEVRRMDSLCVASDTMFHDRVTFCCGDVGREDVLVVFRAYDSAGNYNDCMVNVEVQDKSVPVISCPDDYYIDCREIYDMENLSHYFDDVVVDHNCSGVNWIEETVTPDINQCGTGHIIRLFELKDDNEIVLRKCKQNIYITNHTPFVESNIQWPLDYEMVGGCSIEDLSPERLPEFHDFPSFLTGDDQCSLLGYDYDDKVFLPNQDSEECAHIERTWSVIDWCSGVNGDFEIWTMPWPQIITLINDISPEIEEAGDLLFETQNVDCEEADIFVERTATDDCNNELTWTYVIKNESGVTVRYGNSNMITDSLTNGIYIIEWTVHDGCANFDYDIQSIEVRNTKTPSPVCIHGLSANLVPMDLDNDGEPESEMVQLWASDFDAKSYHNCGNDIVLSLSSDTTITNVIYDCDDIGINMVQLWVTDVITGAQDYCSTFVDIQDNNSLDVCEPMEENRVVIEGDIYTEYTDEIEGVAVNLGIPELDALTDELGSYAFGAMVPGGSYSISPNKNLNHLNGVSTLDLIYIQKHILGMEQLDSPYKLIAADVDNNEDISAIDLIELRKLILGIYVELPGNSSWRFIDALYDFPDIQDPWAAEFPEKYIIEDLTSDMDIDFIGVKIGDVNGSVTANSNSRNPGVNTNKSVVLEIERQDIQSGNIKLIPVYTSEYNKVSGWQGTLKFDPELIEVRKLTSESLTGFEEANYHVDNKNGTVTISYHSVDNTEIQNEDLFQIQVIARKDITNSNLFSLTSDNTLSEAYTKDNEQIDLRMTERFNSEKGKIISVNPNPFVEKTTIEIFIPDATNGVWEYFDVNGRKLYSISGYYEKGIQTVDITQKELNTRGIIYVRFVSESFSSDYKMIVL